MPSGIYIRTKEHKEKLKKSNSHYWLGRKNPAVSIANAKRIESIETKRKKSESAKKRIVSTTNCSFLIVWNGK